MTEQPRILYKIKIVNKTFDFLLTYIFILFSVRLKFYVNYAGGNEFPPAFLVIDDVRHRWHLQPAPSSP